MEFEKIFITGSTGVVGKPLLKKLVNKGHQVYALNRLKNNSSYFEELGVTPFTVIYLMSHYMKNYQS